MRAVATVIVAALALLIPLSKQTPTYMDDPGTGATYGAFYVCLPAGCGWWFCWPGQPCRPA